MIDQIKVSEVMSTNLQTLHPKEKLRRAQEIFKTYEIHHIPIQVMGEIRGIISLGDILYLEGLVQNSFDEFIKNKKYDMLDVDEVMTKRPFCVESDTYLSTAIDLMVEKRVNALLIKEDEKLVGILTTFDLMQKLNEVLKSNS